MIRFLFILYSLILFSNIASAELNICPRMPTATATSHQWVSAITAAGATTLSQPAFTDISGVATIANGGTNNGSLGVDAGGVYYSDGSKLVNLAHGSSGTVLTSGGTGAPTWSSALTNPMTTGGDVIYGGSSGVPTRLANGSANQYLASSGGTTAPVWTSFAAPTLQTFTATGTQTGWLFTISTSSTVAVGDTYTNNSNTYTVQGALTAQSGQVLFMSGTGATSGTTLTRSAGAGTSSITFSVKLATATYTTSTSPRTPLYIRIRMAGGGGGGAGSGSAGTAGNGTAGNPSFFGANILTCGGGAAGAQAANTANAGGTATIASPAIGIAMTGNGGQGSHQNVVNGGTFMEGSTGGSNPLFGGASGGHYAATTTGVAGAANSGAGGSGASDNSSTASQVYGQAGASGGAIDAIITSPAASYPYVIGGTAGGGTAGTNGGIGGAGAAGVAYVEEFYQ